VIDLGNSISVNYIPVNAPLPILVTLESNTIVPTPSLKVWVTIFSLKALVFIPLSPAF